MISLNKVMITKDRRKNFDKAELEDINNKDSNLIFCATEAWKMVFCGDFLETKREINKIQKF